MASDHQDRACQVSDTPQSPTNEPQAAFRLVVKGGGPLLKNDDVSLYYGDAKVNHVGVIRLEFDPVRSYPVAIVAIGAIKVEIDTSAENSDI